MAQVPGQAPRRPQRKPLDDVHIDELLELVVENNASDLHISVGLPPVMRIDGELKVTRYEAFTSPLAQRMLYDILTDDRTSSWTAPIRCAPSPASG